MSVDQPVPISRVLRKRDKKIQEILRATNDVLSEKGYDGVSLDDVAERLDLTKASLYHYFESKEDLLTTCLDKVAEDANARLSAVLEAHADAPAAERLQRVLHEHLVVILLDYPHVSELFMMRLHWPSAYKSKIKRMRTEHDQLFRRIIDDGIASGEFACEDPDLVRRCMYGTVNSVPIWFRARSEAQIRTLSEGLMAILLRMLDATDTGAER